MLAKNPVNSPAEPPFSPLSTANRTETTDLGAGLLVIEGSPGSGKSAALARFANRAQRAGRPVVHLTGDPEGLRVAADTLAVLLSPSRSGRGAGPVLLIDDWHQLPERDRERLEATVLRADDPHQLTVVTVEGRLTFNPGLDATYQRINRLNRAECHDLLVKQAIDLDPENRARLLRAADGNPAVLVDLGLAWLEEQQRLAIYPRYTGATRTAQRFRSAVESIDLAAHREAARLALAQLEYPDDQVATRPLSARAHQSLKTAGITATPITFTSPLARLAVLATAADVIIEQVRQELDTTLGRGEVALVMAAQSADRPDDAAADQLDQLAHRLLIDGRTVRAHQLLLLAADRTPHPKTQAQRRHQAAGIAAHTGNAALLATLTAGEPAPDDRTTLAARLWHQATRRGETNRAQQALATALADPRVLDPDQLSATQHMIRLLRAENSTTHHPIETPVEGWHWSLLATEYAFGRAPREVPDDNRTVLERAQGHFDIIKPSLELGDARLYLKSGRLGAARRSAETGRRLSAEAGLPIHEARAEAIIGTVDAMVGNLDQLSNIADALAEKSKALELLCLAITADHLRLIGQARRGEHHQAIERVAALVPILRHWVDSDFAADLALTITEHIAHADLTAGRAAAQLLRANWPAHTALHSAVGLALDAVAWHGPRSAQNLAQAVEMAINDRRPLDAARLRLCLAATLHATGQPSQAIASYRMARDTFVSGNLTDWADQANHAITRAETPELPHQQITEQEQRVAALAARGLSNKQIAQTLFLSPRTVSGHLYKIFPKLGIESRAALRDALTERGLA